jgi:hypothetical protein
MEKNIVRTISKTFKEQLEEAKINKKKEISQKLFIFMHGKSQKKSLKIL